MVESSNDTYRITWGLDAIRHLSGSLYSNAAAVLTEIVANAWDADAERVDITINKEEGYIEFLDDGVGMSFKDINEKYLTVGYQRRNIEGRRKDTDILTNKSRLVMGRKGLGKLALFYLARTVEVQTMKDGIARGFRMDIDDIENKRGQGEEYNPKVLSDNEIKIKKEGTLIRLEKLQSKRIDLTAKAFRKRLSYRFSVIEKGDFEVYLNNEPITKDKRIEFMNSQMVWKIGDFKGSIPNAEHKFPLPAGRLNHWNSDWNVKGWIATVFKPNDLKDEDAGNLNKIVVLARGRLFEENIFPKLNDNRFFARYLIGEINADFLDQDKMPDIATSGRQSVMEEDERYVQLKKFLEEQFSIIVENWDATRVKIGIEKAEKLFPALKTWSSRFSSKPRVKESADRMIQKITFLPIKKTNDRILVYKHGIYAFERMLLRDSQQELVDSIDKPEKILTLLSDRDSLEHAMYGEIIKSRLNAIRKFIDQIDQNEKEKLIQNHLFKNLWLLDPAWERIAESALTEKVLKREITSDEKGKDDHGRIDIAYRTVSGKHVIVELKRPERTLNLSVLVDQGRKYYDLLKEILFKDGEKNPTIEINFILGKILSKQQENPGRVESSIRSMTDGSPGNRILYYNELIKRANDAYQEYFKKYKEIADLDSIIASLDKNSSRP